VLGYTQEPSLRVAAGSKLVAWGSVHPF